MLQLKLNRGVDVSIESNIRDQIGQFEHSPNPQSVNFSAQAIPCVLSLIDGLTILLCGVVGALAYQLAAGNPIPDLTPQFAVGLLASLIYVMGMNRSGFYDVPEAATDYVEVREIFVHWFITGLLLALVAFLLKVGDVFSRGTFLIFSFLTPIALLGIRKLTKVILTEAISSGLIGRRDTVLLGEFNELLALKPQDLLAACGATEVSRFALSREADPKASNAADMRTIKQLGGLCTSTRLSTDFAGATLERFGPNGICSRSNKGASGSCAPASRFAGAITDQPYMVGA